MAVTMMWVGSTSLYLPHARRGATCAALGSHTVRVKKFTKLKQTWTHKAAPNAMRTRRLTGNVTRDSSCLQVSEHSVLYSIIEVQLLCFPHSGASKWAPSLVRTSLGYTKSLKCDPPHIHEPCIKCMTCGADLLIAL